MPTLYQAVILGRQTVDLFTLAWVIVNINSVTSPANIKLQYIAKSEIGI